MAPFGDSVGYVHQESIGQTEITQRPRIIWLLVGFLFQANSRLRERSVRFRRVSLKLGDQSFAEAARDEVVVGRSDRKRIALIILERFFGNRPISRENGNVKTRSDKVRIRE